MSHTGAAPDTRRAPDWRNEASCREEDPELFFPKSYEGPWQLTIEQAKAICRRCPSVDQCLQFALANNIRDGIFGGLTGDERTALRRTVRKRNANPETVAARANQARAPKRERTLATIFEGNTVRLYGGHLAWTGGQKTGFGGRFYTPNQIAFMVGFGRMPEGIARVDCGVRECVLPEHLADGPRRANCGTRSGYQKHLRERTEPCKPCRRASADADARLRRAGSTKALV